MATPTVEFHTAAHSDMGLVRSNSRDSGYASTNLLVPANGMRGSAGGDIASPVALAHLVPPDTDTHAIDSMLALLRDALMGAHDELSERSRRNPDLEDLGTTCIAIMRSGNKLAMMHIGDSHAYVLQSAALIQVMTDHSFVQYLVETRQVALKEAEHHPNRNAVLHILGDSQMNVTPDETIRETVLGDRWLLCSDGLSGVVSPKTIGSILAEIKNPGQYAEELIRLALHAGGPNNVIYIIADIVGSGSFPPAPPQIVGAAAPDRNATSYGDSSAAARAAAFGNKKGSDLGEDNLDLKGKRGPWLPFLITALVTLMLVVVGWDGWAWIQSQYHVIDQDEHVVVHQRIPQSLDPWKFSHSTGMTDIALKDLSPVDRQRLQDPVMRPSREQIDEYLA